MTGQGVLSKAKRQRDPKWEEQNLLLSDCDAVFFLSASRPFCGGLSPCVTFAGGVWSPGNRPPLPYGTQNLKNTREEMWDWGKLQWPSHLSDFKWQVALLSSSRPVTSPLLLCLYGCKLSGSWFSLVLYMWLKTILMLPFTPKAPKSCFQSKLLQNPAKKAKTKQTKKTPNLHEVLLFP